MGYEDEICTIRKPFEIVQIHHKTALFGERTKLWGYPYIYNGQVI